MRAPRPKKGKHAIAAALGRLVEEHSRHRRALAMADVRLHKLADVTACIANEIAAASAAHVAEMTALRQQIAESFGPRLVRRLRDKAGA